MLRAVDSAGIADRTDGSTNITKTEHAIRTHANASIAPTHLNSVDVVAEGQVSEGLHPADLRTNKCRTTTKVQSDGMRKRVEERLAYLCFVAKDHVVRKGTCENTCLFCVPIQSNHT